jgi:hypothetical protein
LAACLIAILPVPLVVIGFGAYIWPRENRWFPMPMERN